MSWHEEAFRILTRLYPAWFRNIHGEEMAHLFRARLARTRPGAPRVRLWWRTVRDAVETAVALRRHPPRRRRGRGQGGSIMGTLLQDIRYAARHLARGPLFTVGAAGLLAVGIGANTAVFTVVDSLLLRPPPWTHPEEVVYVYQDSDDGEPSSSSFPATRDMAASPVFQDVAAITASSAAWEGPDGPETVAIEFVTSGLMDVLGLSVQRGRWFGPEHDAPGAAPVAVVSAPAWRTRFGGDPGVVGRTVRLNGQLVTIVGVGPDVLTGTYSPMVTDFWLSISATPVGGPYQVTNLERRTDHWYDVRARLAPGVTVQQAQSAMDALATRLAEDYPDMNRGRGITVFGSSQVRLHPGADGDLYLAGGLLAAVVLTVLLLACANLANLLLVRGLGRSAEMAVRTALGASRSRVARLFLFESLLLSALGGAGGLLLARGTLGFLPALPLPRGAGASLDLHIDMRVVAFSLVLVAFTGVVFGLAPALRSARADVSRALRDDLRSVSGSRGTAGLRGVLVAVQVAASLVLVLGTGLLARSLAALQDVDTGVDAERVAYIRTDWNTTGVEGEARRAALDDLLARVAAVPGVSSAAAAFRLPAQQGGTTTTEVEGYTPPAGTAAVELAWEVVTDDYFATLGVPVVAGRTFGPDETPDGGRTALVINQAAADRFWPGQDPLGRRMRSQGSEEWTRTVVGVVGNVPVARLGEDPRPMIYFSSRQLTPPSVVVLRTDGDPAALLAPVRQTLAVTQPSLTVREQGTLAGHFGATLSGPRTVAALMSGFSALALILAGLGIYAVVSFSVARRTAELGIRIALGAERSRVIRMVVGEVVGVVALGLAGGTAVALLAASRLEGMLYGVAGSDPVALVGAVTILASVALVAAYVPARGAARADPAEALRVS